MANRVKERYESEVKANLMKEFNYSSVMEIPKIEKIVVNIGVGDATGNSKLIDDSVKELQQITGQKPVVTKAKKSVANFKVRQDMKIGAKVTLRGTRMYEFFDKFMAIALPRVRDFRGLNPNSFDGRGNYAYGVHEQLIFPEIVYDKIEKIRGFDICFVTSAKSDNEARSLLKLMGMPFKA